MQKLRVLDLFSGIGGFSIGLERTGRFETVAFCEYEDFPRRVLAKHWPDVPCFPDVRELRGLDIDGPVDVICGGYPCQPFSTAGKRGGEKDDRHLWPEFMRLVAELRPTWVIGENVAGHISMGLDDVLSDLENAGYTCRSFVIPACAVGASHRRDRVWTLAHSELRYGESSQSKRPRIRAEAFGRRPDFDACGSSDEQASLADAPNMQRNGSGNHTSKGAGQVSEFGTGSCADNVADAISLGRQGQRQLVQRSNQTPQGKGQTDNAFTERQRDERRTQSRMGRMADGFSCWSHEPRDRVKASVKDRAARLKALGNAVHPDIPMMLGAAILEAEAAQ
jgi:DNA (cytosine-5)-methyltransferase 1